MQAPGLERPPLLAFSERPERPMVDGGASAAARQRLAVSKPLLPPFQEKGHVVDLVYRVGPAQPAEVPGLGPPGEIHGRYTKVCPYHFEFRDGAFPRDEVGRPEVVVRKEAVEQASVAAVKRWFGT